MIGWLVETRAGSGIEVVSRPPDSEGYVKLPRRWVVERTFAWLGRYRRNSRDDERSAGSSEAMIKVSSIHRMIRLLKPGPSKKAVPFRYREYRGQGERGVLSRAARGRPPELTLLPEKSVRRWLADSPTDHGFETELWTAPRLARLIREEFGIELNPRSLSTWLRARGFSPQTPQRVPGERDPEASAAWLESDWPRIKKRRDGREPKSP